jgi:O-antigen ligase
MFLLVTAALLVNHAIEESVPQLAGAPQVDAIGMRVQELLTRQAYLIFLVAFLRKRWQILLLVWVVVACVLVTAPSAIWNALSAGASSESAREAIRETARAATSFGINLAGNANRLAFLCVMAVTVIGFALPETRSRVLRAAGLLAIGALVLTTFLSASRSGLIELAVLFVMLLRYLRIRRRQIWGLLLAMVVAVGLSLLVVPERHLERITNFGQSEEAEEGGGSTRARLALLEMGARMFADNPLFGAGVANFRPLSIAAYGNVTHSALHNSYLLALVEGGLLLFAAYMLLFRSVWREIRELRRLSPQHPRLKTAWLVAATQAIFILFLIFSVFADIWHELFLYIIVGIVVTLGRLYRQDAEATPA